jgi:hypothetical protein
MRLWDAVKASNVLTVIYKGIKWSQCLNYEDRLDFIGETGGGWYDAFLSNHITEETKYDFEPFIASEEDLRHPKWKHMHEKYKIFQEMLDGSR